ncbi:MAG TPA: cobalamin biosynthesis bifunctional protein CbiET, partial [Pseudonocardia sp.]|nr:cobalamin biosynthesis bifunctional protein CbiET [Pseudonocardia sp.]
MTAQGPGSPVAVVGIGADGWPGLSPAARRAVVGAEVVLGSRRQLELLTEHPAAEYLTESPDGRLAAELVEWPSPLLPALPALFERLAGRRVC